MLSDAPTVGYQYNSILIPFWLEMSHFLSPKRTKGLILQYGLWTLQPVLSRDKVPGGPPDNNNNNNKKKKATWIWCGEVCDLAKIIADSSKVHQKSRGKPQPAVHRKYLERVLVQPIWETGTTQERLSKKLSSYYVQKRNLCSQHFSHPQPTPSTLPHPNPFPIHIHPYCMGPRPLLVTVLDALNAIHLFSCKCCDDVKMVPMTGATGRSSKGSSYFSEPFRTLGHDAKCKREGDDKISNVINAIEWSFRFWSRRM